MKENLFNPKLRNNTSRNGFDLSRRAMTTMKMGMLVPTFMTEVLPADKVTLDMENFTRTLPINQAAFTRMRIYHEAFFVPYRLLWRFFPQYVVERPDGLATSLASTPGTNTAVQSSVDSWTIPFIEQDRLRAMCQVGRANMAIRPAGSKELNHDPFTYNKDLFTQYFDEWNQLRVVGALRLATQLGYFNCAVSGAGKDFLVSTDTGPEYNGVKMPASFNQRLNPFPFLAYQKIYADFFRNQQWEKAEPWTFNVDYVLPNSSATAAELVQSHYATRLASLPAQMNGVEAYQFSIFRYNMHSPFDIRYCDYNRDYILGAFPSQQFGATASVDIDGGMASSLQIPDNINIYTGTNSGYAVSGSYLNASSAKNFIAPTDYINGTSTTPFQWTLRKDGSPVQLSGNITGAVDVLKMRYALALQKYREITLSQDADYSSQIEAHFGISVPSLLSNSATFLGSNHEDVQLQTIANQNLADGNQSSLQSMGTASGKKTITLEAKEHGLVMVITYIKPLPDYPAVGLDPITTRVDRSSYAQPEFDKLGQEAINPNVYSGLPFTSKSLYGTRYYDYKSNYDVVLCGLNYYHGGDMPNYTMMLDVKNFPLMDVITNGVIGTDTTINYRAFKVCPAACDTIFFAASDMSYSTDQFVLCDDYRCRITRNLSRSGMPY